MLKVRLMGTKSDIKWFRKILQRNITGLMRKSGKVT